MSSLTQKIIRTYTTIIQGQQVKVNVYESQYNEIYDDEDDYIAKQEYEELNYESVPIDKIFKEIEKYVQIEEEEN